MNTTLNQQLIVLVELEEMRTLLEYVHGQARGDGLRASIKDDEMLAVYLSAGEIRKIARMMEEK